MNKTAIKNYAIWARVQLIESAKQRAFEYGVTEESMASDSQQLSADSYQLSAASGRLLSETEKEQRRQLISEIRQKGYPQVMEEAAYTWFNRFIALRFMEVNGYLPSKVRVFTDENGAFKPDILKEAVSVELEGLDRGKVLDLIDRQDNEALYKYLLITQCNALNKGLPLMFEKIANWTELLFPANLLKQDSVIGTMISSIPEEDWTDAVQIIGWLYQYYNSELKDETFALLKKNVKITKERIPAATQLFTPDWIVRYMVENSLGRIAVSHELLAFSFNSEEERQAKEKEIADSFGWKYYLPEAPQTPEVRKQLSAISHQLSADPTTLRVLDPCMGSGHILVYAFDVLLKIYTSAGWSERDAAKSIVENNLYGIDIDDRAGQLAYFAVMMKARKYSRRILNGEVMPNVISIQDSNWMTDELVNFVTGNDHRMKNDLITLRSTFRDAKEYGSILNVPAIDYDAMLERLDILRRSYVDDLVQNSLRQQAVDMLPALIKQARIMARKYDVVVTNPPYMGGGGMSAKLSEFVKNKYPDSKSDLFAVFIERCREMTKQNGYQAMITQHAWMFLSSFEKLREKLNTVDTVNMSHLGARAFEEIGGEVVQTTSFVMRKTHTPNYKGTYCRLIEPTTQQGKEDMFLAGENRYTSMQENFEKIPGSPIAYWISKALLNDFVKGTPLGDSYKTITGSSTGDNSQFLRLWFEVAYSKVGWNISSDYNGYGYKWIKCNKGGSFRRWFGNNEYVINWENDGSNLKAFCTIKNSGKHWSRFLKSLDMFYRPGICWSKVSSGEFSARIMPEGFIMESAACAIMPRRENVEFLLSLMNSKVASTVLKVKNPTINMQTGDIVAIPVISSPSSETKIKSYVEENVSITKSDWNSFETSWDFKKHPLI